MRIVLFTSLALGMLLGKNAAGQILPGGIKGVEQWLAVDTIGKNLIFKDLIANRTIFTGFLPQATLNQHPAIELNKEKHPRIPLTPATLTSTTIFTVYQPLDTVTENIIWQVSHGDTASLVLSTRRMADLSSIRYMNYRVLNSAEPKISIYSQQKNIGDYAGDSWHLTIGDLPALPKLPASAFHGLLPEIVIYPKVLASKERIQVASYLALKYGITLSEPNATYLSSNGDTIWDGNSYSTYHHNIAGVARDDSSGLKQQISTSGNHPGMVTFSATDSLANNRFLLWGDNNKPLAADVKTSGMPQLLQKKWLLAQHGTGSINTNLLLDTKQVDYSMPDNPVFWMIIDTSGTGEFQAGDTKFIRMSHIDNNGYAHFDNLHWSNQHKANPIVGFYIGGKLVAATSIKAPPCDAPQSGQLTTRISGGVAPYTLTLKRKAGQVLTYTLANDTLLHITQITAGKYNLHLTDISGQSYTDSFYVNNDGVPSPANIQASYILPENGSLKLNAAVEQSTGITYSWHGPNQFASASPDIKLTQAGIYTLHLEKGGCIYQQDIAVRSPLHTPFDSVLLYPNPSRDLFKAKVTLESPAPIVMNVYTIDGRLVLRKEGKGFANYLFAEKITTGGIYIVSFTTGQSTISKKLVISR